MENKTVTWTQINNWVPLIVLAMGAFATVSTLDRRLALLEQKLDDLITVQKDILGKYGEVETRYGALVTRVTILESKAGIK